MANHASAEKKHRSDERKRMANRQSRSKMRNKIKVLRKKISTGKKEEAQQLYPQVVSIIDQTIRKGTIHKNTGARYKSRLTASLKKANAAS
jgi:small subunit ribosomal protein S20